MEKQFGSINSIIEEQEKQIVKLQAENRELRKALAFYADEKMYRSQWNKQLKVYNKMEIKKDRGEIARKALGEGE